MSTTHQIAESSSQMSADLSKIESYISLGDNCEFGFVQRNAGFEPSGLLRWAIAKPIDVVRFLENIYSCLLYTSPSPRDQRGSRMPSSA